MTRLYFYFCIALIILLLGATSAHAEETSPIVVKEVCGLEGCAVMEEWTTNEVTVIPPESEVIDETDETKGPTVLIATPITPSNPPKHHRKIKKHHHHRLHKHHA
jgi:hypothetical protein